MVKEAFEDDYLRRFLEFQRAEEIVSRFIVTDQQILCMPVQHIRSIKLIKLPAHGEMLYYGATTCWETFPGWEKERLTRSHCHGWSAAPSYFFGAYILGVKPVSPGFKEVVIQPFTCGLKWAKGSVPTPKGIISVYWELRDGKFSIDVKAPEECKYHVIYPDSKRL